MGTVSVPHISREALRRELTGGFVVGALGLMEDRRFRTRIEMIILVIIVDEPHSIQFAHC